MNTSQTGSDFYPWDWSLTDAGEGLRQRGKTSGVEDTLGHVKSLIDYMFRP